MLWFKCESAQLLERNYSIGWSIFELHTTLELPSNRSSFRNPRNIFPGVLHLCISESFRKAVRFNTKGSHLRCFSTLWDKNFCRCKTENETPKIFEISHNPSYSNNIFLKTLIPEISMISLHFLWNPKVFKNAIINYFVQPSGILQMLSDDIHAKNFNDVPFANSKSSEVNSFFECLSFSRSV